MPSPALMGEPDGMADTDVDVIAQAAALAPSVHNTQPWRFDRHGDTLDVRAERDRRLAFLDPVGRQLFVSCGAAVEFASLAARSLGRECAVEMLPDRGDVDVVARLRLGAAEAPSEQERRLAEVIVTRYTDRGAYTGEPVPSAVVSDAQQRAAELDVWLRRIDDPDDRRIVIGVLAAAETAEASEREYVEELTRWTERAATGEGMPAQATAPVWPANRVSDLPLRDFTGHNRHPRPGEFRDVPPSIERDLLLMVGTASDDPPAWLASGRALGWLLLRAAADGVSAQPLGQAIDLPAGRSRLRAELGLVGHPQMLLRLGFGSGRPQTPRRSAASG